MDPEDYDYYKTQKYLDLMNRLSDYIKTSNPIMLEDLREFNETIYKADLEDTYSKPMVIIGVYIAIASLACVIAMGADLLSNLRSNKLWFPCRWFTINAFYLTVIAVAMKLPVDLSSPMPDVVDQGSKLGSLAFMCTMMANFLPSLATMDKNQLLANVTALGVLVVTLAVNVCIQISTRVISSVGTRPDNEILREILAGNYDPRDLDAIGEVSFRVIAAIYVALLLLLLIIYVSSALTILSSKQIIESKYKKAHEEAKKDVQQTILPAEKLQQHVSKYWIMAGSGSPQLIIACTPTTTATGVLCALTFLLHVLTMSFKIADHIHDKYKEYESDYKWSTLVILIVQSIGVLLGTVAPFLRCLAPLSLKLSFKLISKHINVIYVESYWTKKLSDWKHKSLPFRFRSLNRKVVLKTWKSKVLNICSILQWIVVVVCKIIALIPFFIILCVYPCLQIMFPSLREEDTNQQEYVLLIGDDTELAGSTMKSFSNSFNLLIQKSDNKHPENLLNLIKEKSTKGFQGVKKLDNDNHQDCWSLTVVTLAAIAVTQRKIKKKDVKSLMKSVREGLEYVALVEETLNPSDDHVKIQKVAQRLWQEVDVNKLKKIASQVKATSSHEETLKMVQEFFEKPKDKSSERVGKKTDKESSNDDSEFTYICANSMSHIIKTILDDHNESPEKSLVELISSRIADIMAACLTNLPEVIVKKCETSTIEKREKRVKVAAILLGETKQIINYLHDPMYDVPIDQKDRPFISKWVAYLSEP